MNVMTTSYCGFKPVVICHVHNIVLYNAWYLCVIGINCVLLSSTPTCNFVMFLKSRISVPANNESVKDTSCYWLVQIFLADKQNQLSTCLPSCLTTSGTATTIPASTHCAALYSRRKLHKMGGFKTFFVSDKNEKKQMKQKT